MSLQNLGKLFTLFSICLMLSSCQEDTFDTASWCPGGDCSSTGGSSTVPTATPISCRDQLTLYPASTNGTYEIDPDGALGNAPYDVYCNMSDNAGGWTRVFLHDSSAGYFANDTDAIEKNLANPSANLYSILSKLQSFKRDGKFEFWLNYEIISGVESGNIWTQTSNPTTSLITGYVGISIDHSGHGWGGLELSSYAGTFIDGTVGHANWYYAIGPNVSWNGGFPGPSPAAATRVKLYIR